MRKIVLAIGMGCLFFPAVMKAQEAEERFTHKTGSFEIILLAESQGKGDKGILIDATPEMMQAYAPDGTFPNAMNAFLVKTPEKNILVDAGLGQKLIENLQASGVSADEVNTVLITHMHGDHIGGC